MALTMPPPRHTAASRCRRPPRRQWQRRHRQALGRRFRFATLTAATLVAGAACCCPRHHHSSIAAAAHALSRTHCLIFVCSCPSLHCPLPLVVRAQMVTRCQRRRIQWRGIRSRRTLMKLTPTQWGTITVINEGEGAIMQGSVHLKERG